MNRSWLFVPGDSERKFTKALEAGADALIIDLEDSVAASRKDTARGLLPGFLGASSKAELWVRINPAGSDDFAADLDVLHATAPAGIVLPKAAGADDVRRLDEAVNAQDRRATRRSSPLPILPLVTERPEALFRIDEYAAVADRLAGLTWGAEDLAAAIGAQTNRDGGEWTAPYQLARSLCLLGAAAAGVAAVETVYTDLRDAGSLAAFAKSARRDGFAGMLLIHPAQIGTVHEAFTPDEDEIERAERIVAQFEDEASTGVAAIDGRMIDRPHYLQARRLLDVARRSGRR